MPDSNHHRVLVKEKIADAGVELLREHFDVDVLTDMSDEELAEAIAGYEGIVIRSATKLTSDLIGRAERLRVIGRAGIGVDNVDVPAATKRGIIVANAPESNIVTAAEHTIAMMLAQARNIPQAHSSLKAGKWERSKFGGVEVYEKTLGIVGFGRIGQLVAQRAKGFAMDGDRLRPVRVRRALPRAGRRPRAGRGGRLQAGRHHHHSPAQDPGDAELRQRGGIRPDEGRGAGSSTAPAASCSTSTRWGRRWTRAGWRAPASTSFPNEPMTEHPIFAYDSVVVTPHLAASTTEAQDRAGVVTAEQVVAALTGGLVTNAVNIPTVHGEDLAVLEPYMPLASQLGRLAMSLAAAPRSTASRSPTRARSPATTRGW